MLETGLCPIPPHFFPPGATIGSAALEVNAARGFFSCYDRDLPNFFVVRSGGFKVLRISGLRHAVRARDQLRHLSCHESAAREFANLRRGSQARPLAAREGKKGVGR